MADGTVAEAGVDLSPGARRLVHVNGRVRPGEIVVVVTDPTMGRYAEAVASAAREAGAAVTVCIISLRDRDGQEPPPPVGRAMAEAAVIFSPVRVSITHTRAMRTALEAGARVCMMTAYTDTSPRGTDLRFGIAGRVANVLTNIPNPGELAPVPDIEVNVVPVTGSAAGTLIMDASVPYLGIGILEEPIVCAVRDGAIVDMTGGAQADFLRKRLESFGDPHCFNVAELGVGLNPNARLTGEMLEDEGVMGTIHIGIGTSYTLGGEIVAPMHYDLLMWAPTIAVDGRIVQRDRQVLV